MHALGTAPAPIAFQALTAERLAEAIREAVTSTPIRERAKELGAQIDAEDGVGCAIGLLLRYVTSFT